MNDKNRKLKDAIIEHMKRENQGIENAIVKRDLALLFDLDDRSCQALIEEIVCAGEIPIGGSTRPPFVYYIITNKYELETVKSDLKSRISRLSARIEGLDQAFIDVSGQDRLFAKEQIRRLKGIKSMDDAELLTRENIV